MPLSRLRLFVYAAITLLACPLAAFATGGCPSSAQFGTITALPANSDVQCQSTYYTPLRLHSTSAVGPFTAQWPSTLSTGYQYFTLPLSFVPTTAGSYSGSVTAMYQSTENQSVYVTISMPVTGTYAPITTISGFINPKYLVLGVTYAPPGSSSTVPYS